MPAHVQCWPPTRRGRDALGYEIVRLSCRQNLGGPVSSLSVYVGIDVACAIPRGLGNREIGAAEPFQDAARGVVSAIKRIVFEMGWQIERIAVDAPAAPPATSSRASENELAHLGLSSFRTPPTSAWAGICEQCANHLSSGAGSVS
jgi:hypothetical protein